MPQMARKSVRNPGVHGCRECGETPVLAPFLTPQGPNLRRGAGRVWYPDGRRENAPPGRLVCPSLAVRREDPVPRKPSDELLAVRLARMAEPTVQAQPDVVPVQQTGRIGPLHPSHSRDTILNSVCLLAWPWALGLASAAGAFVPATPGVSAQTTGRPAVGRSPRGGASPRGNPPPSSPADSAANPARTGIAVGLLSGRCRATCGLVAPSGSARKRGCVSGAPPGTNAVGPAGRAGASKLPVAHDPLPVPAKRRACA